MKLRWTCAGCGTRYWRWRHKHCEPCRAKVAARIMEAFDIAWEAAKQQALAGFDRAVRTAQAARIERDGGVN